MRLFCATQHLWLRHVRCSTSECARLLQLGLTERGISDVGSVVAVTPKALPGTAVQAGDPLLEIEWDGHHITQADELYHTRFETFTSHTTLRAPVGGMVVALQEASAVKSLDPELWLAQLHVEELVEEEVGSSFIDGLAALSATDLVGSAMYAEAVAAAGPGRFSEEEENRIAPR